MIQIYSKMTDDPDIFKDVLSEIGADYDLMAITMENRRCFRFLETLKRKMAPNDILMIASLRSLGLNDTDIAKQLDWIIEESICLIVCDTTSTYEYGIGQPMNKAVISTLRHALSNSKIATLNKRANSGRSKIAFPDNWDDLYELWEKKEISSKDFISKAGLKKATFYNLLTEYRGIIEKAARFRSENKL